MNHADIANDLAAAEVDSAVAARVVYRGESADACVICDALIPSERQLALPGVDMCVDCVEATT